MPEPFDAAKYLDSDGAIEEFLLAAFETGEADFIARSIGAVARAKNISQLAHDVGMSPAALHEALGGNGNPEFATMLKVLNALGIRLSVNMIHSAESVA